MSELRRLTWKYFFKQKWEEMKPSLIPGSILISVLLITIGFGFLDDEIYIKSLTLIIIGSSIFGLWLIYGITLLIKEIYKWLKSNWNFASERAEQELNPVGKIDLTNYGE